jgi:hypothetical protein
MRVNHQEPVTQSAAAIGMALKWAFGPRFSRNRRYRDPQASGALTG